MTNCDLSILIPARNEMFLAGPPRYFAFLD